MPRLAVLLAASIVALAPTFATAQPAGKQITIVVPFPPGAGPDIAARVMGEKLATRLARAVVVENRPGVGGLVGAGAVAKATPDGSTLLLSPNTLVISPHVLPKGAGGGLDVMKDLLPVVMPATTPMLMIANPALGAATVEQVVALAKSSKPELAWGSAGNGSPMHFAGAMFGEAIGAKLSHVPYRGSAPLVTATIGGEIKLGFVGLGGVSQHLAAGKLVAIAVAEKARTPLLPNVPTFTERGVKGVEVNAWYGIFAAAGTPPATVASLNEAFNEVLKLPDLRERLGNAGLEMRGGKPQDLGEVMRADDARYGRIARELKISAD
jgi:tripartite-type tricarboxylate transporter receptor subunit TctC